MSSGVEVSSAEEKRLEVLYELNILDSPPESAFDNITYLASQICQASVSLITLFDRERDWFKSKVGTQVEQAPVSASIRNHLIGEYNIFTVTDLVNDDRIAQDSLLVGGTGFIAGVAVPLVYRNVVIGSLSVLSDKCTNWNNFQQKALEGLSRQVIELFHLHKINTEANELRKANERNINRLQRVVDGVADLIYEMDENGQFTFVNEAMIGILGYSRDELIQKYFWDLVVPEDMPALWDFYYKKLKSGVADVQEFYEYRITTKTGEVRRMRQKVKFKFSGNRAVNTYAVASDITRLYETQQSERKSLEKYKLLAENATDLVCLNAPDGTYRFISPSVTDSCGYSADDMLGKKPYEFFHPDDIQPTRERVQKPLERGETIDDLRFRFRTKSGEYRWMDTIIKPILEDGAMVAFQTTSRDITQRVQEEEALKRYYDSLASMDRLASTSRGSLLERIQEILEVARDYFNLPLAIISEIRGKEYTVIALSTAEETNINIGDKFELDKTYCESVFRNEATLAIDDAAKSDVFLNHPCHKEFGLKSYIGSLYRVDGKKRGTINFSSPDPRPRYFTQAEREFIEVAGSLIGFLISIEEKQQKVSEERNLLNAFVTNSPASMAMFDTKMDYLAASRSWELQMGKEEGSLVGKNHYRVFPLTSRPWRRIHQRCLAGQTLLDKEERIEEDDRVQWLRWQITPWYVHEGVIGGIIIYNENITHLKEQNAILTKARIEAEEASALKENFLSTMSHEIRTPLNSIIGFSNILLRDDPRSDQLESLKLLKFSGETLLALIDNILDLSKIQAGKIELEIIEFDLNALLQSIVKALSVNAKEKQLRLHLEVDSEKIRLVKGDKSRLAQVLNNLVGNAVKFTEEGSVNVKVELVDEHTSWLKVKFEIEDTGIGIPEEKVTTIFDAFHQASTSDARRYGGTGLGLTIARNLVHLMGGSLEVKSKEDVGSNFYFTLRMDKGELRQASRKADLKVSFGGKIGYSGKILLVEDNIMNQVIAKNFLEEWGLDVDVAENGLVALEMIDEYNYGLILLDLQMPEMDGYEATKNIRNLANSHYRKVPIIALTASALLDIKERALNAGMNDFVSKPFDPQELHLKISTLLMRD